jgi:integrase
MVKPSLKVDHKLAVSEPKKNDCRHSVASLILAAGVPAKVASEGSGHAQIAISLDIDSHVLPMRQQTTAESFASLILGQR